MDCNAYDALTFDVYGTLIDWEPAILARLSEFLEGQGIAPGRPAILDAFDRARAHYQVLQPARPYPRVLASAFAYIADEFGAEIDRAAQQAFAASVGEWPAYDDSLGAMARLGDRFKLGALTNMDDASFAKSHARLGNCFDVVVTAERSGAYKPALPHFVLGLTDLAAQGIPPARVLHVAQSLRADVRPANLLGLDVVWIDRADRGLGHTGFGAELAQPLAAYPSMAAFTDAFLGQTG